MEFTLTVDLEKLRGDDPAHELARILRYWAGAMKDADLEPNSSMNVYDSHFARVGRWSVGSDPAALTIEPERTTPEVPEMAAPTPTPELPETPGEPDKA